MNRLAGLLPIFVSIYVLGGCGAGYVISGRAVEGVAGSLQFVSADDGQLADPGVAYADVSVYRDATRPNERLVATGRSDGMGNIEIPINEIGAGWMIEQWRIEVVKPGYETVQAVVTLPSAGKNMRMLIVLAPGISIPPKRAEDLWEEYERFR